MDYGTSNKSVPEMAIEWMEEILHQLVTIGNYW